MTRIKNNYPLGQCNDWERAHRTMPSWDNTGRWLAMSGTHSPSDLVGNEDSDVFVARITDELSRVSMREPRCLAVLPGDDILPVYSSDGKQIAFAHQDVSKATDGTYQPVAGETWSLYLVGTSKTKEPDEYPTPRKVLGGLTRPERLSWFPDGKRLLVSFTGNDYEMKNSPQIVDVDKETASQWKLPTLHDPDLAGAKPLIVREASVSPDGKRVAFRALCWTGEQKDAGAVCIYSCDLDGSNLTRLTPPTNEPLQPLVYPVAGVTALNAWQKLEPKRNLGTLLTPEQIEAQKHLGEPKPVPPTAQHPIFPIKKQ